MTTFSAIGRRVRSGIAKGKEAQPLFRAICRDIGIPEPVVEWKFALPERKWAFDYAWPESRVALEVEGGGWISGAHNSGSGFLEDIEKYNAAAMRGWIVVRCVPGAKERHGYRKTKRDGKTLAWTAPALLNLATARLVQHVLAARLSPPPIGAGVQLEITR